MVSRLLLMLAVIAALAAAAAGAWYLVDGQQDAADARRAQQVYQLQRTAGRMQQEFTRSQVAVSRYVLSGRRDFLEPVPALGAAFRQDVRSLAAMAPAGLQALVRMQQQAGVALFAVADRIGGLPPMSATAQTLATGTTVTARNFAMANGQFSGALASTVGSLSSPDGPSFGAGLGWCGGALATAVLLLIAASVTAAEPAGGGGPLRALTADVRGRPPDERAAPAGPATGTRAAPAPPPPGAPGEPAPGVPGERAWPGAGAPDVAGPGVARPDVVPSDFLATISHELRAPLTTIEGYVEMLADDGPDQVTPAQQKMLDSINRSAVRLRNLVDDVFTLARLESGAASLATRPVDLPDVIAAAADAVRPAVAAAGLSLTCTGPTAGMTVAGDAGQVERVMINLLSNAVKFTPAGGGITVTAAAEDEWGVITVADSGIGIPERDQKELFTRFFRASNARERAIPGTGLGLAIVRTIMVSHGGEVELESREGSGTTVTVRLPLRPTPAP
jgi:histidine kinase/DNA gyrase B/HSP90-like ATPase/phospho-acceptor domain-containing protein